MSNRTAKKVEKTAYSKIKELRRELESVSQSSVLLLSEKQKVDSDILKLKTEQKNIEQKIKNLEQGMNKPELTDHARVQFFNRCLGFNIDQVDKIIITEKTEQIVERLGENSGKFPFVVENVDELRKSLIREDFVAKKNFAIRLRKGLAVTVIED